MPHASFPTVLSSFVGRERELADLAKRVRSARLSTLTGPAGCGKTRLALQVASAVGHHFPDGAVWVELAQVADPALIPKALAAGDCRAQRTRGLIIMATPQATSKPPIAAIDFHEQPFILAWELTRACNLACVHCRAEAQLQRVRGELSFEEARGVIDQIATFPVPPIMVLTGGDPMRRPDIASLVEYGSANGIRCTVTPAGTPLASPRRLAQLKKAGVARIAVSLDGPSPVEHDSFRQVTGSFKWTMDIIENARDLGIEFQLHTTLCRRTLPWMAEMADLADQIGPAVWAVFCLVPTGRAMTSEGLSSHAYEQVFNWLYERRQAAAWDLKLTEGYHYRRVQHERDGGSLVSGPGYSGNANGIGRAPKAVNAGNGFCFISHAGDIMPSGFLPIVAGNVRRDSLVDVYRDNQIFRNLRDPARLTGKCGGCGYGAICGGSRSRAFAHTGDYLASDPACVYVPG